MFSPIPVDVVKSQEGKLGLAATGTPPTVSGDSIRAKLSTTSLRALFSHIQARTTSGSARLCPTRAGIAEPVLTAECQPTVLIESVVFLGSSGHEYTITGESFRCQGNMPL